MFRGHGEILCDDRMIVRKWPDGYRIHGTWSHGELPDVSPAAAPLRAIFFIDKADEIEFIALKDKRIAVRNLLAFLIKPLATADWWEKILDLVEDLVREVPCYTLRFDRSGRLVEAIRDFIASGR